MRIFSFFVLFVLTFSQANAQWSQTGNIEGCTPTCFSRYSGGILCGTFGGLYSSNDEGQTWQLSSHFLNSSVIDIVTKSDTIIVCYAGITGSPFFDSAYIKTSFDGGLNWNSPVYVTENFWSISMEKFGDYILINTSEKFYRSYDNGLTWMQFALPSGQFSFDIRIYGKYALVSSIDMSQTYYSYICDTSLNFQRIDINNNVDSKVMIDTLLFGYKTTTPDHADVFKSSDLGQTWSLVSSVDSIRGAFTMYNDTLFYYVYPTLYKYSSDQGITWNLTGRPRFIDNQFSLPLMNGDEIAYGNYGTLERTIIRYDMATGSNYISDVGTNGRAIMNIIDADSALYCVANTDLMKSIDGGNSWTKQSSGQVFVEFFISNDSLFTHTYGLSRSYDGGVTWTFALNNGIFPPDINYIGKKGNRFYATSNFVYTIWYSDDFGDNWFQLPTLPQNPCNGQSVSVVDMCAVGNDLFIASSNGVVSKLDSANTTWTHSLCFWFSSGNTNYPTIQFTDNKLIVCSGSNMYVSLDTGSTWLISAMNGLPVSPDGNVITPQSIVGESNQLIGHCSRYGIYTSFDNGNNWSLFDNSVLEFTPYCLAINNHQLLAGSSSESLWKYNTLLNTVTKPVIHPVPDVYPNPASNQFTLTIKEPEIKNYVLKLLDISGKTFKQVAITSEQTIVSTDDLNSGMYFGKLVGENFDVFKVLVIK